MASGTVKWFNPTKGYGFIQPQGGGGRDVFVHISAVERAGLSSLNEGQAVEYEIDVRRQRSLDRPGGLNKGKFLAHRNVHRSEDETANPSIEGTS
jgi:CspA family cold shock protein